MPELPEVETVKRQLKETIIGQKIQDFKLSGLRLRREIPSLSDLKNQTILNIFRRNKYLIIELNYNWLVIHLGMTGQLIFVDKIPLHKKHVHCILHFWGGHYLYYEDPRRFGSIDLYHKKDFSDYHQIPLFENLGFEPLEASFTFNKFNELFSKSKNIKSFLMDASFVCGIGNIYASEILFLSKISPKRDILDTSEPERKLLFQNIKNVLKKAIELGGSSISDFVHVNGQSGKMQNFYNVYGRNGLKCNCCNHLVEKINQNGRSTFFCPSCQK